MTDANECPTCHRPKTIWPKEKCAVEGVCTFCHGNCAPPRKITSDELLAAIPAPPAAEPQTTGIGLKAYALRDVNAQLSDIYYLATDVDRRLAEREAEYWRLYNYTATVLDRLTGGRISQPFTDLCAVETECEEIHTKDLIADHARIVAEMDRRIEGRNAECNKLQRFLNMAASERDELRTEVTARNAENAQLRDHIELLHGTTPSPADGAIEMQRTEIDTLLRACGEKDATINDLRKRLEQRAAEIARLTQKVTMQRSQIKGIHQARKNERRPAD